MTAIEVRGVAKRFRVHHAHRPYTLHEALSRGFGRLAPADPIAWLESGRVRRVGAAAEIVGECSRVADQRVSAIATTRAQ